VRLRTTSDGNGKLSKAWKALKLFHPVRYEENVGKGTLLIMTSWEAETRCSNHRVR